MSQRLGVAIFSGGVGCLLIIALLYPAYLGFAVAAAGPLVCIVLSGLDPARLACGFLAFSVIAHTLKRVIFLFGDQSQAAYYAIGLGPFCVAVILLFIVLRKKSFRLPTSALWLLAFAAIAASTTLFRSLEFSAFAGLFTYIAPMVIFFGAIYLPDKAVGQLSKTALRLGVVSVLYGLWQLAVGPTFIDIAWAERTQEFSTQASKVFSYLYPSTSFDINELFRPYSLHSDPFAWAMSLTSTVALAGMARSRRGWRSKYFLWSIAIALLGLPLCLSRSPVVGCIAMVVIAVAIRKRYLRGPTMLVITLAASAIMVVSLGQYLIDNFVSLDSERESSVGSRYLTVGTFSARTGAGSYLLEALREYPLMGSGLGSSATGSLKESDSGHDELAWSHNIVVDLVFTCGGIGAGLFFLFVYQYFVEMFVLYRKQREPEAVRVAYWSIAAVGGFILTGFASGAVFLNDDFFLLAGLGAGWAARRRLAPSRPFPETSTLSLIEVVGQRSTTYAD